MIWNREEYIAHMKFQYTGKEMFTEIFGPLIGLEEEWKAQGASEDELNLSAFGWDTLKYVMLPVKMGAISHIRPRVLEDTREYTVSIDRLGRKVKLCKGAATLPLPLNNPVKTMDDWLKIKPWYEFREERVDMEELKKCAQLQKKGFMTIAPMPGGFDEPRELMGEENLCIAYYEDPEMIEDMLNTMADTACKVFERVSDAVTVDLLHVHEDMAGKSGPMIGPNLVSEFINPYYHKIWDPLKDAGASLFSQDSDGSMNADIDAFLDAGLNVMYPCEPAAGMDIVEIRKTYKNRLALKGGLDKHALRGTRNDIERELRKKICPETMGGGTVFALDHRIPNGVPIENYRYYVQLGREMLGLAPAEKSPHIRMAF